MRIALGSENKNKRLAVFELLSKLPYFYKTPLELIAGTMNDITVCVFYNSQGFVSSGESAAFQQPAKIVQRVLDDRDPARRYHTRKDLR
ncbi:hypothetical protein HZA96_01840 [Candidatus Woesearchaeota archaeon]|nr:hypothetical protein [Candidatus Woesearchaeota archaeon]